MIPFNKPPCTGNETQFVLQAIQSEKMSGDGQFSRHCQRWFEEKLSSPKTLMTPSCTASLEMAALLIDIQPGDEVIMPSFTFVSTANAFALRGAKIVFVDIRPDTMNIDEKKIEAAITHKTKAIVPVHYAGVSCDMDAIMAIASAHNLYVIEDAAQGVMASYQQRALGSIGHLSAFSFHDTKNYTSGGEGGLLIINDPRFIERAEIIREKGTNRSQLFRGLVDKYSWVDIGSSFLPSELQSAYLWGQLQEADNINNDRLQSWKYYYDGLEHLSHTSLIERPFVPADCRHNGHLFYIKVKDLDTRTSLIEYLKKREIHAAFHYIPLHTTKIGIQYGRFSGEDLYTTRESERLVRLPLWYGMKKDHIDTVLQSITEFYL